MPFIIVSQIVGIVAIFFAVELPQKPIPSAADWLLIAFVAFHFIMHLILSLHQCSSDMRKDKTGKGASNGYDAYPMRGMNGHKMYHDYGEGPSGGKRDAPGSGVRKFLLVVYLLVAAVAAAALILLVFYNEKFQPKPGEGQ